MAFYLFMSVIMRYLFNSPLYYSDEIPTFLLLLVVFFSIAHTTSQGEQINTDFLLVRLPMAIQRWLRRVSTFVGLLFSVGILMGGIRLVVDYWERQTMSPSGLSLPLFWPALVIPFGGAVMFVVLLNQLFSKEFLDE